MRMRFTAASTSPRYEAAHAAAQAYLPEAAKVVVRGSAPEWSLAVAPIVPVSRQLARMIRPFLAGQHLSLWPVEALGEAHPIALAGNRGVQPGFVAGDEGLSECAHSGVVQLDRKCRPWNAIHEGSHAHESRSPI